MRKEQSSNILAVVLNMEEIHTTHIKQGARAGESITSLPMYLADESLDYYYIALLDPSMQQLAKKNLMIGDLIVLTEVKSRMIFNGKEAGKTTDMSKMFIFSNPVLPINTCKYRLYITISLK